MPRRSYAELIERLRSKVDATRRLCASFDQGNEDDGELIAVQLRALLHNTRASHALLAQLGLLDELRFTESSKPIVPPLTEDLGGGHFATTSGSHGGLTTMASAGGPWRFIPAGKPDPGSDRDKPPVAFGDWWFKAFFRTPDGQFALSRKKAVTDVANKDGAHVDAILSGSYAHWRSGEAMPFRTGPEGGPFEPMQGGAMATVRQIAAELLDTMEQETPNFLREPPLPEDAGLTRAERAAHPAQEACLCGSGKPFESCHGA